MNFIIKKLNNSHIFFLPIAIFFILISTAVTNLFVILVFLVGIFQIVKEKKYSFLVEKKFLIYSMLLYIMLIISVSYSEANNDYIYNNLEKYFKFFLLPVIYVYVKINKNENLILKYFLSGVTVILFFSYLKYFKLMNFDIFYDFCNLFSANKISEKVVLEKSSIFMHYINHGIIMSAYFFVTLILGIRKKNIFFIILSILSFINIIFLTDSRTAYVILLAILVLFLYSNYSKTLFLTYFISALLLITFLSSDIIKNNFSKRLNTTYDNIETIFNYDDFSSSVGKRYFWLKIGLDSFSKNPFFGSGAGSFKNLSYKYINYQDGEDYHRELITNNPHNEYVSILVQIGLSGLILFLLFILSLFRSSKEFIFSNGITLIVFISCAFNSSFYDNMLGIFLIILIAVSNQENINKSIGI